jgi:hypothetical protein
MRLMEPEMMNSLRSRKSLRICSRSASLLQDHLLGGLGTDAAEVDGLKTFLD